MLYCYDDTPPLVRNLFFFLRTRKALEFESEALEGLTQAFPFEVPMLGLGREYSTWDNGFVLRIEQTQPPVDVARRIKTALDKFDAWAIHDGIGEFIEQPPGGLLDRYFKLNVGTPFSQLFVMARNGDSRYGQTVEQLAPK